MQKLQTVNAETLLYEPLEKPSFVVDSLIPTGLSLFCGSQKIGKSWLMLKLCLCVSQGIPLWDMPTMEGDVLYLCLEDTFCRIQDRLFRLTDEASGRLHFAVASCKLSDGLIVQLEDYLKDYPDSRLIVIDTLQKVRTASKDNAYASDYGDISLIKDFADRGYPKTAVTTVTAVTPKDGHPPKERRNPPMPYAILRFQKRKAGGVAACERHNERKKEAYKSNPDIDMERSKNNYHLIAPPKYTYKKEINRMVAEAGCRTRKDSVMMVETLITASPEFMNQLPPEEQKAYFQTALDFISERVGKQNILSAVVHMDERTPHMHLCFVPITPDNKLSAKAILGNQKSLSEWQTAYHERMSSRWNQLERGQSSMETKRKHVPTWLYKLGGRLDKQYEEIVSALSDINAFNAGKKRDKALDLLSAWLPDVEKFSKEIGKQQAYIDSLKERIGQESDYAGRMRDEKYEQELKVQKANQKIFELQRTNEQMGRLLSKIPPEVLEELQKNHRSRAKER